ncbi:MAG TPA: hypothetical protein VHY48_09565 [Acidobacteriaceae bacterium]|jgi:hypothetical protein|nr:hypothetical protein [Acidobacteriaceae bacterium]
MSILGLDGRPQRENNIFQRIFWPGNHAGEADALGQQGFWVCLVVGLLSAAVALWTGHPLLALLTLAFYWLGGMGVREHSVTAAIIVALGYIASLAIVIIGGRFPGLLDIAITAILIGNIRGTYVASSWQAKGDPEVFPSRMNTTFFDWLVDQIPAKLWPKGRYVFFLVSAVYGVLLTLGTVALLHRLASPPPQTDELQLQLPASNQ